MGQKGVKRPKKFTPIHDPTEKLNPNSLRETLSEIEREYFLGNRQTAAKELTEVLRRGGPSRYRRSSISPRLIESIIEGRTYIKYWHLEVFAELVGVPTSILLLYSRLKANEHSKDGSLDSERVINTVKHIARKLKPDTPITIGLLREWAEVFQPEPGTLFDHKRKVPKGKSV